VRGFLLSRSREHVSGRIERPCCSGLRGKVSKVRSVAKGKQLALGVRRGCWRAWDTPQGVAQSAVWETTDPLWILLSDKGLPSWLGRHQQFPQHSAMGIHGPLMHRDVPKERVDRDQSMRRGAEDFVDDPRGRRSYDSLQHDNASAQLTRE